MESCGNAGWNAADRRDAEFDVILSMPVVVGPDHVRHDVATGVWCGVTEATDLD